MTEALDEGLLAALQAVDTPTICNAIEIVKDIRQNSGFTRLPVVAADPGLPAMVGYARCVRIRAAEPPSDPPDAVRGRRHAYYGYVVSPPAPTVVVLEDADWPDCAGAFWGEVNVAIHKGLGVVGALTNGTLRDLGMLDGGFQVLAGSIGPSHAFVHVTALDVPVAVLGLEIRPGDLIHADRHGAVVIEPEVLPELPRAIDLTVRREKPILAAARAPGFTVEKLRRAWADADDVH